MKLLICNANSSCYWWSFCLHWQMKPWCSSPRRNLWHLSQRSKEVKLDSTNRCWWAPLLPWAEELPSLVSRRRSALALLLITVPAAADDDVDVERWQSSSTHTRMAFWWNSSLTPIFCECTWNLKQRRERRLFCLNTKQADTANSNHH